MQNLSKMQSNNLQAGFTLIESLLAIGILGTVAVQILGVQTGSIAITQISRDNIRASWAMRSVTSQLEYVLDSVGVKALAKEHTWQWSGDENFRISVVVKDLQIEASKLLGIAMKLGNAMNPNEQEKDQEKSEDSGGGMKEIFSMLDSQLPKDMYKTVKATVSWKDGETEKTLEGGVLTIDTSGLNLASQASALGALMGGGMDAPGNPSALPASSAPGISAPGLSAPSGPSSISQPVQ